MGEFHVGLIPVGRLAYRLVGFQPRTQRTAHGGNRRRQPRQPGYAADASQADVLLAIEKYRPDLIGALQLPTSKGFAFTPAFAAR